MERDEVTCSKTKMGQGMAGRGNTLSSHRGWKQETAGGRQVGSQRSV